MQLSTAQGDGASLRTHLQRLRANTGRVDPLLAAAAQPLPSAIAPLWEAFVALSATRGAAFEGVAPITCLEIEAWCRLHAVRLSPWEVETLLAVDRAARGALDDARAVARQQTSGPRLSPG